MTSGNPEEADALTIPAAKVDAEQEDEVKDSDEEKKEENEPLTMSEFFYPSNKHEIIQKRWGTITLFTLPFYIMSLFLATYGVDQYADVSGRIPCVYGQSEQEARATYQTAIGLTVVYHSIEFFRQLLVAFSSLIGTNLIMIYYVFSINVIYGIVALIWAVATRLGPSGSACVAAQPGRATYLILQLVPLILMIFSAFHILFYMRVNGVEWCNEVFYEVDEDEEDEEEED